MKTLLEIIDLKVKKILELCNYSYDESREIITNSNRPELSDFQCNEALRLAKIQGKNPREIAQIIVDKLQGDSDIENLSIDGPGFINISVSKKLLKENLESIFSDEKLGFSKKDKLKLVIDFSSPNVGKPLHVGHLRSVIGESLKRIMRFAGDEIIGDNHLGDWGKPMGLIIAESKHRKPTLPYFLDGFSGEFPKENPFTNEEVLEIYPTASSKAKENEDFNQEALEATRQLQAGKIGYRNLIQKFLEKTREDLDVIYKELDISFDTWYGESFYNDLALEMTKDLEKKGFITDSQGAKIIELKLDSDKKEFPPLIMQKTGGGIMYGATDLATIKYRIETQKADGFLILTDNRQGIHFEQVFRAAEKIGILKPKNIAENIQFGTINGLDGKPFKTRDGNVLSLSSLISQTKDAVRNLIKERDLKGENQEEVVRKIGMSALKFADLSNDIKSGYVFDLNKFISFEGKTGPYILYTYVRLNSVLNKLENTDSAGKLQESTNEIERDLMLHMTKTSETIAKAYRSRSPHSICEFLYDLCQKFNRFYKEFNIANETDEKLKSHRIAILNIAKKELEIIGNLIGLEFVDAM